MQFARFCALVIAFVLFPAPHSIKSQEPPSGRVAPIRRLPGYEEGKRQADIEREEVESRRAAPEPEVFAPTPRAAVISEGFAGMDFNDTIGFVPPDTHAATSATHIVETVNTNIAIYNRTTGTVVLGPTALSTFFSSVNSSVNLTDPIVAYDELLQRFFIGVIDFGANETVSHLLYAVSDDSAPTGVSSFSHKYSIAVEEPANVCGGTVFADFTRYGWNADAHVFTFNMFNAAGTCFDHVSIITIDKSTIGNSQVTFTHANRSRASNFTLTPTVMHGSNCGDPMWFVESVFTNQIRVVKMTNVLDSPSFANFDISVAAYGTPPNATQGGGGFTMDTGDTRILNVEWRGNRLVATHTVGVSGLAQARWYEFDTSTATPTISQQGTIAPGSGIHTYYPSIAIAANGDLGLTFMESSTNEFVSMYVTGQAVGDAAGTMQTPVLVQAGAKNYSAFDCDLTNGCRAGDYSGITADPDLSDTFCAANEYATNAAGSPNAANWGTWISCFSLAQNLNVAAISLTAPNTPLSPLVCQPPAVHDLAVTKLTAPKSLAGSGDVIGSVKVTIQNRSDHSETLSNASVLGDGVTTGLVRLDVAIGGVNNESCLPADVVLDPVKTPALFSKGPKILKPKSSLTVTFLVTYNCSGAMLKGTDPDTADYTHTATVHHDALPGGQPDTHLADDMCPRAPLGFDPNPPPKGTTDKGCGAKTPNGLGGPVVTDIVF
jgi:hypothetical protein